MSSDTVFNTRQKIKTFEEWFSGDHVLIHLDSRREGVSVPGHLNDNPALTLKLSYLFQGKTSYDDESITAYLKFSGEYCECVLPWSAIWGMTAADDQNTIWPDDLPRELVFQFAKAKVKELGGRIFGKGKDAEDGEEQQVSEEEDSDKPRLHVTETEKNPTDESYEGPKLVESDSKKAAKRKPPNLKVIK